MNHFRDGYSFQLFRLFYFACIYSLKKIGVLLFKGYYLNSWKMERHISTIAECWNRTVNKAGAFL